ncbi:MAG: Hsp33 family molecular chaperone [Pseudomonadota bacterium]
MSGRDEPAARRASSAQGDDIVLPFQTERSGVAGRIVRLGTAADTILARHDYPDVVCGALGEALALTALLGSALKFEGKLILQTKTDGILGFLVADFEVPGRLRGYASFDAERLAAVAGAGAIAPAVLWGHGHLAMTIDPGGDMDRTQGVVALEGVSLSDAALSYFRQSEQLPTLIRLAVARHYSAGVWQWRAGGLLLQHVGREGGTARSPGEIAEAEELGLVIGETDDDWTRVALLAATVEDHELLDPTLAPERLLYRLFHEEGVRVFQPRSVAEHCRCSRERVASMLGSFGAEELADMREADGAITVKCEFCNTSYRFVPGGSS